MGLTRLEFEANWEAISVAQNMDFRGQTASWGFARLFVTTFHRVLLKKSPLCERLVRFFTEG